MDFQLRKDARRWFRDIAKCYDTLFDLYYLCLMAGFAARRKNTEISSDAVDSLVDYFPDEFRVRGRLLVGLFLHTELSCLGIDLDERDDVYRRISQLVDPQSLSHLSNEGVRLMNQYAHGGFDVLCEFFSDRPTSIETFLRKYERCLENLKGR